MVDPGQITHLANNAEGAFAMYALKQALEMEGQAAEVVEQAGPPPAQMQEMGVGMYFDDVPTWRYTAGLGEWKRKADDVLDTIRTASAN